jgi:hypothetical protein
MQKEILAVSGVRSRVRTLLRWWLWLALLGSFAAAHAQTCQSADDLDANVRAALEAAARKYFDLAARGDYAALQQNSIAAVASNFSEIEAAVKENQSVFTGAQATLRPVFLLMAEGNEPLARAEFLCGVFGPSGQTSHSAVFVLNNLPPGKYGLAILDVHGTQDARTLTLVLQQVGADWKLAGFYARLAQVNGHDGAWFAQRAREFKTKGQARNAWLYYHEAIALSVPVDFMSTLVTDKLYDEMQGVRPNDLPVNGNTIDLSAGTKTYHLTEVFPLAVGTDLDIVAKYQAADVSNTGETYKENSVVTKALVARFPEFRDAFAGVVVRAVEPSGRDYGSLVAMKDIK